MPVHSPLATQPRLSPPSPLRHAHATLPSFPCRLPQDSPLFNWLTSLYPAWATMTSNDVYISAKLSMAELLLSGCTCSSGAPQPGLREGRRAAPGLLAAPLPSHRPHRGAPLALGAPPWVFAWCHLSAAPHLHPLPPAADHLYIYPNDVTLDDTIRAAREIGMRFHPTRGIMTLGKSKGARAGGHVPCGWAAGGREGAVGPRPTLPPLLLVRWGMAPLGNTGCSRELWQPSGADILVAQLPTTHPTRTHIRTHSHYPTCRRPAPRQCGGGDRQRAGGCQAPDRAVSRPREVSALAASPWLPHHLAATTTHTCTPTHLHIHVLQILNDARRHRAMLPLQRDQRLHGGR